MNVFISCTKRFFVYLVTSLVSITMLPLSHYTAANGELAIADELGNAPYTKTFTISAYYSPLPCQARYATGSYEADIRLNGNGTNGADGTEVYPGMVAAPKSYSFGTKMDIPGIGIVAVHDRGGAIVASNSEGVYDRLDIWMGFGDVGLKRALNWGKRSVDVTVYGVTDAVDENMTLLGFTPEERNSQNCSAPNENLPEPKIENDYQAPKPVVPAAPAVVVPAVPEKPSYGFMEADLNMGASGVDVLALQEGLKHLNLFRGEMTGFYGEVTAHAVFKFQQIHGLVMEESSAYAGVFGAKTRGKMNEILAAKLYVTKKLVKANVEETVSDKPNTAGNLVPLSFGMTGKAVTDLQLFLRNQGVFDGAFLTEYFGPVTKAAVVKFQLKHGIISSEEDTSAGVVGPATLEMIGKLSQ